MKNRNSPMPFENVEPSPILLEREARERPLFDEGVKIRPFVRELAERLGDVTAAEWCVPMNSYERSLLVTKLELGALLEHTEYCRSNCMPVKWTPPLHPTTYDETLAIELVPELILRLRDVLAVQQAERAAWGDTSFDSPCFAVEVCDDHDGGSVWISEEEFIETKEEAEELSKKLAGKRDNGLARVMEVRRKVVVMHERADNENEADCSERQRRLRSIDDLEGMT